MNIILIKPPQQVYEGYEVEKSKLPLKLATTATYIKQHFKDANITCLDLFSYSKENAVKKIVSKLKHCQTNIIYFDVETRDRFSVWQLAEGLKLYFLHSMKYKEKYKLINVIGGQHADIASEQIKEKYKYIDFIIKDHSEKSMCRIIEAYQNNTFRNLEKVIEGIEIDYNKIDSIEGLQYFDELTSMKQQVEISSNRKAFNIYSEMLKYENYFGINSFEFSNITNIEEFKNLCRLLIKFKKKYLYKSKIKIDSIDESIIKLMKESGCYLISTDINTKLNVENMIKNCNTIKYYEIQLECNFAIGQLIVGELDEVIKGTKQLIRQLKPDYINTEYLYKNPDSIDYWLEDRPVPTYHSIENLKEWSNELYKALRPINILIAAPVSEDKETFEKYIDSLNKLNIPDYVNIQKLFILDNCKELEEICKDDNTHLLYNTDDISYNKTEKTHEWKVQNLQKVASFKNQIVDIALENNFDYIFWIDSDLILDPETLNHLLAQNKNIISEIFWTKWTPEQSPTPNAWMTDHFTFQKENQWDDWKQKGVYEVGGTGACILVDTKVYRDGANYTYIPNVSFSVWEDRAFCIRSIIAGHKIYLDSHYPATHLYRK